MRMGFEEINTLWGREWNRTIIEKYSSKCYNMDGLKVYNLNAKGVSFV